MYRDSVLTTAEKNCYTNTIIIMGPIMLKLMNCRTINNEKITTRSFSIDLTVPFFLSNLSRISKSRVNTWRQVTLMANMLPVL